LDFISDITISILYLFLLLKKANFWFGSYIKALFV